MSSYSLQDKRHILVINAPLQFLKAPSNIRTKIDTNLLRVNTFFIQCQTTFIIVRESSERKEPFLCSSKILL